MTLSFHHQGILIADMLNSKIIFPPLYIISMTIFYMDSIQIIFTGLFPIDLTKEFGIGSLFTGELLLLKHYVNANLMRVLYFLFKSSNVLLSIVINIKYKKSKISFIIVCFLYHFSILIFLF